MSTEAHSSFSDRLPFKGRDPDYVSHLGIARSGEEQRETITGDPAERAALAGRPAEYRLVFQSMEVPGLPERFTVGRVQVFQAAGPVWTQYTHITQRPGWRPVYEKWMEHRPVGTDYRLTICVLPVTLTEQMQESLIRWRDEVLAALSFVVALLDERVAQLELAEDVIAIDPTPGGDTHVLDTRVRLREFTPANRVLAIDRQVLEDFGRLDTGTESPLLAAGRWYLRAAQLGPTADAVVFLWIALEALSKPAWGTKLSKPEKRRTDVDWVEEAVRGIGFDLSQLQPDIGRLAGLRAEIVHGGVEAPALLRPGTTPWKPSFDYFCGHAWGLVARVGRSSQECRIFAPRCDSSLLWRTGAGRSLGGRGHRSRPSREATVRRGRLLREPARGSRSCRNR